MGTRGRPRSEEIDAAILDASIALLLEVGYSGLSMEALAARAGVGKPTIYRRWPSKAAVIATAMFGRIPQFGPDTGNLRTDVAQYYLWAIDEFASPEGQSALPGLIAEMHADEKVAAYIHDDIIEPIYQRVRAVLVRAQDAGEIRPDLDLDLVIDTLAGTAFARTVLFGRPLDRELGQQHLDLVLDSLAVQR